MQDKYIRSNTQRGACADAAVLQATELKGTCCLPKNWIGRRINGSCGGVKTTIDIFYVNLIGSRYEVVENWARRESSAIGEAVLIVGGAASDGEVDDAVV